MSGESGVGLVGEEAAGIIPSPSPIPEDEGDWLWLWVAGGMALVPALLALLLYLLRPPPPKPPVAVPARPSAPAAKRDKKEEKQSSSGPKLKIFWGSQTGTAEDFAETLGDEAKKYFNAQTVDLEDYDTEELAEETLAIFVLATYGEGEPTDNAKEFYDWLLSDEREQEMLSSLRYTVFGLGNRTYEHYNAVGRTVDRRLEELGARSIYPRGEGDDDSSLEEDFLNWKKGLWTPLCDLFGISPTSDGAAEGEIKPKTRLEFVAQPSTQLLHAIGTTAHGVYDHKMPFIAEVVINRELHEGESDRSCRHVEFAVPDNMSYEPGDHLGVFPRNDPKLVEQLVERLGVTADLDRYICLFPCKAQGTSASKPLLGPTTLRMALIELKDITNPPRKSVLGAVAQYAANPSEQQRLRILASADESSLPPQEQYARWVKEDRRTIGEILEAFPSLHPPLGHMLELLPDLAPRYYSISSSPKAHSGRIHITSVVVQFDTGTGRRHNGVCSSHFLALAPAPEAPPPTIPIFVRKSTFRLPPQITTPVVMVGPGTGLAPFRGFIHERKCLGPPGIFSLDRYILTKLVETLGESVLFFGCRHSNKDFIYKEELLAACKEGHLTAIHLAFSRDQEYKVYVQDKIRDNKELLWRLLSEKKGHFYICGDARSMAPSVRLALLEVIMTCGSQPREAAEKFVAEMQERGRFQTDVWF